MWKHEEMYDVHQVAAQLLLTEHTVYQYLRSGELRGVRVGRGWRVEEGALRDYLRGDRGQSPRVVAHAIKLVHLVDPKPESVCYEFPDGYRYKCTMFTARRLLQSPELANGRGFDLDERHHLSNQDAMNLMISLASYFAKVAPGGAFRMFATRANLKDPQGE
jgi:excisionase family DNA binding protein